MSRPRGFRGWECGVGRRLVQGVLLLASIATLAVVAAFVPGESGAASERPTRLEQAPRIVLASPKRPRLSSGLASISSGTAAVEIEARDPAAARAAVVAAGGRVEAAFGRLLEARVPASYSARGQGPAGFILRPCRRDTERPGSTSQTPSTCSASSENWL